MTAYNYSIASDLPAPNILKGGKLHFDIQQSSIAKTLLGVTSNGDDINIEFDASLSGAEETTLDGLVAAHNGVDDTLPTVNLVEEVTVDKATTSTAFVDLLSKTFICKAGTFTIAATYSMANSIRGSEAYFQIVVDGVAKRGGKQCAAEVGAGGSGSLACKVALTRGEHTIKLQWKVSKGSGSIRPVSRADEHAFLEIREVV